MLDYVVKNTSAERGWEKREKLGSGAFVEHFMDELGQLKYESKERIQTREEEEEEQSQDLGAIWAKEQRQK